MLYKLGRWIVYIAMKLLFDISVEGLDKIPSDGPLVVCANHISWWDPLLLACIMPRPVHFMAKKELFSNGIMAFVLTKLHAFPVNREKADVGAIRKGLAVLNDGNVIGVFPEGTRQKTPDKLGPGHGGAALLAIKTGACVLPVAIRGRYGFRGTVKVACGNPMSIAQGTGRLSTDIQAGSLQVMGAIKDLWETLNPNEAA
ncbi:MAG TPA: 1-acyl-sn-glycerol-3-phosphate acyltransferase [Firmicutes bacterium]|nr:1-acyl-sn-glycerol-3-phosphate acyltransferase [Candidatus Fermentithermobacillaceae bacterium]